VRSRSRKPDGNSSGKRSISTEFLKYLYINNGPHPCSTCTAPTPMDRTPIRQASICAKIRTSISSNDCIRRVASAVARAARNFHGRSTFAMISAKGVAGYDWGRGLPVLLVRQFIGAATLPSMAGKWRASSSNVIVESSCGTPAYRVHSGEEPLQRRSLPHRV
jgi:hypothetical protein